MNIPQKLHPFSVVIETLSAEPRTVWRRGLSQDRHHTREV
jgi:hypothetical protein